MIMVVVKFSPPGIWPVQQTRSGKGAAKGDLSNKPLWNSGGETKLDNHGKALKKTLHKFIKDSCKKVIHKFQ